MEIFSGNPRKVIVSREDVAAFNARWPCSTLRSTRHYWFEFDTDGNLIDTDVPEHEDGPAASAMADDAREFWRDHKPVSDFERTGRLCRKIDVYRRPADKASAAIYLHSTNWHRTCREAVRAAAWALGLPPSQLFARRGKP